MEKKVDRKDFLKNAFGDIVSVSKDVFAPLIEKEVEKLDKSTDLMAGQDWKALPEYRLDGKSWSCKSHNIGSKSFFIVISENSEMAIRKQCPTCKGMLTVTEYDKKCKCFICDKSFSLETSEGDLAVERVTLRRKDGKLEYLAKKFF